MARGQRDRPWLTRQRADPDRAGPAVLAELEGIVAQQHGRPGQGQADLAAAVPALVAEGADGAKHYPGRVEEHRLDRLHADRLGDQVRAPGTGRLDRDVPGRGPRG